MIYLVGQNIVIYRDAIDIVAAGLDHLSLQYKLICDIDDADYLVNSPDNTYIVFGTPNSAKFAKNFRQKIDVKNIECNTILLFLENLPMAGLSTPGSETLLKMVLDNADIFKKIYVHDAGSIDVLTKNNVSSQLFSFGYTDNLEIFSSTKYDNFDVVFIGTPNTKRKDVIRKVAERCNIFRCPPIWGTERNCVLQKSKICLNIHSEQLPVIEVLRLIYAAANKSLIISEKIHDSTPFVDGEHYISCNLDEMPSVVEKYLGDDLERNKIIHNAYNFIKTNMHINETIRTLIDDSAKSV